MDNQVNDSSLADFRSLVKKKIELSESTKKLTAALDYAVGEENVATENLFDSVRQLVSAGKSEYVVDALNDMVKASMDDEVSSLREMLMDSVEFREVPAEDGEQRFCTMFLAPVLLDTSHEGSGFVLPELLCRQLRSMAEELLGMDYDIRSLIIDPKVLNADEVFGWTLPEIYDLTAMPKMVEAVDSVAIPEPADSDKLKMALRYVRFWFEFAAEMESDEAQEDDRESANAAYEILTMKWVKEGSAILSDYFNALCHLETPMNVDNARHEGMTLYETTLARVSIMNQMEHTELSKENLVLHAALDSSEDGEEKDLVFFTITNGAGELVAKHKIMHGNLIGNEAVGEFINDLAKEYECVDVALVPRAELNME